MDIPIGYILDVIHRNCRTVKRKSNSIYNFPCPICNEGKSKGKKKRGFFFAKENYIYCQNCQRSWSPINWIMELEQLSFKELLSEASDYGNTFNEIIDKQQPELQRTNTYSLPYDSINLLDDVQLQYYKNNKIVQHCLQYIHNRKLNTAINKPKTFFISLNDKIHRNRLCIPFYDANNKLVYYQTRALYKKDEDIAKYLSKKDDVKTLYGINTIDPKLEYIFIFEGPIDSMFCKNGVAACGLTLSAKQKDQIDKYRLFKKIWVLDNQLNNIDVCEKYKEVIDAGESIFFWPNEFSEFKDVNDICVATNKNYIPPRLFINNALSGIQAELKLLDYLNQLKA